MMAAVTHHLPPEPGVTEIRIHGVGGTTPAALLEQSGVQQVSGDTKAGMFRGAVQRPDRTVEAYSWGGLTARSRSRAFWVLLLPFSLVNIAGWMVEPKRTYAGDGRDHASYTVDSWTRSRGTKWHESFVQLIGITTTAMYVMWLALISMNALAFQCGGIEACREGRWYMEPFGTSFFLMHPGRRIVVGLIAPLGLLAFFWILGNVSRTRYDDFAAQEREAISLPAGEESRTAISQPEFWHTSLWQENLARIHVSVVVLILSGLLARASIEFESHFDVDLAAVPNIPSAIALVPTGILALAAVVAVFAATWRSSHVLGSAAEWLRRPTQALLAVSLLLLALSAYFAWHLEVDDARLLEDLSAESVSVPTFDLDSSPQPSETDPLSPSTDEPQPPTPNTDLWGFGWAPIILLGMSAVFVGLFSIVQLWRWIEWKLAVLDQFVVPLMFFSIVLWQWAQWLAVVAGAGAIAAHYFLESSRDTSEDSSGAASNGWRLGVFLTVCFISAAVALATKEWAAPYGQGWPRVTPILVFTGVLIVLSLLQTQGMFNSPDLRAGVRARLAFSVVPGAMIVVGLLLAQWSERSEWFSGLALLSFTVMAVVWLAQFRYDGWRWNGPAAVAVFGLSIVMGGFSGIVIWLVDILDRDGGQFALRATGIYEWLAVAFAVMLIAVAGGFGCWFLMVQLGVARAHNAPATPKGEALPEAVKAVDVVLTVAALLLVSGVLALIVHLGTKHGYDFQDWIDDKPQKNWRGIVQAASWIALGVGLGAFFAVRSGLKDEAFRTRFGILWDVASFWPRSFHPFAPPAYAARAVPELQARLKEVATRAADQPNARTQGSAHGAVILSGHSQGSVISLAAIASVPPEVMSRVCLVTHGSPLDRFYHLYFPKYFPRSLFDYCASSLGQTEEEADGGWLNFWRRTDPIGAPVYGARDRQPPDGHPSAGVSEALVRCATGVSELPDVRLDDPIAREFDLQLEPEVRGHSGYMADPGMWMTLDAMAADLQARLDSLEHRIPGAETDGPV